MAQHEHTSGADDCYFTISALSREDLEKRGFDTSHVDDKTMEKLAEKLGEHYCENLFWDDLEATAGTMGIPRNPDWTDENGEEE